jgi:pyridoxal phosphate enzyme (YggS family)
MPPLNALVQVNIDQEESKTGVSPDALGTLLDQLKDLDQLRIRGLMCLPSNVKSSQQTRDSFARLRKLRDELISSSPNLTLLSMGMSKDFPLAIQEGSDIVRIGTALFGARSV